MTSITFQKGDAKEAITALVMARYDEASPWVQRTMAESLLRSSLSGKSLKMLGLWQEVARELLEASRNKQEGHKT